MTLDLQGIFSGLLHLNPVGLVVLNLWGLRCLLHQLSSGQASRQPTSSNSEESCQIPSTERVGSCKTPHLRGHVLPPDSLKVWPVMF